MTHLMRGVVEFGTSTRAKKLRRPVAGKTGTTNDFRDAWFMGGTADLVTGVRVGRTRPQTIAKEATGGVVALPIWEGFMEAVHKVTAASPARDFPIPDDVTLIHRGDHRDGLPVMIPFQRGKMPKPYLADRNLIFGQSAFN
jgi:penicillin-binding protein 1A